MSPKRINSPAREEHRTSPAKVFISYAHQDSRFEEELMNMLTSLTNHGIIQVWHDREIEGGTNWYRAIRSAMNNSDMAILLVSQYFLNSEFIQREEVPVFLKKRKREGMRVVPIVVRHCLWEDDPVISKIQVLPRGGRPVITFPRANGQRDKVWKEITQSIGRRARGIQRGRT